MSDPKAAAEPDKPIDGQEYFRRCLGGGYRPAVSGKERAAHPTTIRRVFEEAKTRFPEAADVIAALVFWKAIDMNREEFLEKIERERRAALYADIGCNNETEKACTQPFSWDDGVPYCDVCGRYRQAVHIQDVRRRK